MKTLGSIKRKHKTGLYLQRNGWDLPSTTLAKTSVYYPSDDILDEQKPNKVSWFNQSGAGFTLLELMVTIAITGILTAMIFFNYGRERFRNDLKAAVRMVQVDLQAMQTNAQAGVLQGATVPNGYGMYIDAAAGNTYTLFADNSGGATGGNGQYDGTDTVLRSRTLPGGTDISITPSAVPQYILFLRPNGKAVITASALSSILRLKSNKLSLCYAITVTANVGTVSSRQISGVCP